VVVILASMVETRSVLGMIQQVPFLPSWIPQPSIFGHELTGLGLSLFCGYMFLKYPLKHALFLIPVFLGLNQFLWLLSYDWPSIVITFNVASLESLYLNDAYLTMLLLVYVTITTVAIFTVMKWFKPNKLFFVFAGFYVLQSVLQIASGQLPFVVTGSTISAVAETPLNNFESVLQSLLFLGAFYASTRWLAK